MLHFLISFLPFVVFVFCLIYGTVDVFKTYRKKSKKISEILKPLENLKKP